MNFCYKGNRIQIIYWNPSITANRLVFFQWKRPFPAKGFTLYHYWIFCNIEVRVCVK